MSSDKSMDLPPPDSRIPFDVYRALPIVGPSLAAVTAFLDVLDKKGYEIKQKLPPQVEKALTGQIR